MSVSLEVTQDSVYMIETTNESIRMHGYLKDLQYILIHELYNSDSVTLSFQKKPGNYAEMVFIAEKKNDLICAILCLRSVLKL